MKLVVGLICLFSISAHAATLTVPSGNYKDQEAVSYGGNNVVARYKIASSGSQLRVADSKHGITYAFDLNSTEERALPEKAMQYIKSRETNSPSVTSLIDKITFGNFRNSSANVVTGDLNIYLKYESIFGRASMKLVLEVKATTRTYEEPIYVNGDQKGSRKIAQIVAVLGSQAKLVQLDSALGATYNNAMGIVLDLVARTMIPAQSVILYEARQN